MMINHYFSDLQARKTTREDAWKVDGWSDTVYKTGNKKRIQVSYFQWTHHVILVRLVDSMHSYILKPLDYSPLK